MKKISFVSLFVLVTTILAAQSSQDVRLRMSGVYYIGRITYIGKYKGKSTAETNLAETKADKKGTTVSTDIKLTKKQWEFINYMLDLYEHGKGDTFHLRFVREVKDDPDYAFTCEFTSDTEYTYWVYLIHYHY
jgi:hypothetical protein